MPFAGFLCSFKRLKPFRIELASVLFFNSASTVHDLQAYRNMEMTRERISFTFDSRDMLLSLQMGFSFVRAAVACAILERISGFGAIIRNNCSKVLEACYSTQLLPFYLYHSGSHWRCLSPVWSSQHCSPLIPCAAFGETFY